MDWNNIHDAPDFSSCLEGQSVTAKVVSVYDGDSIKAIFPFNDTLLKWTCRIDGVDTPEVRTRNADEKNMVFSFEINFVTSFLTKLSL